MFGLIKQSKYNVLLEQYNTKVKVQNDLEKQLSELSLSFNEKAKQHQFLQELCKQLEEASNKQIDELSKLETIEIEKSVSALQVKEFGEECLKQVEEACIEDMLEELKSKIIISKDKEYSIHKITTKITIQNGN